MVLSEEKILINVHFMKELVYKFHGNFEKIREKIFKIHCVRKQANLCASGIDYPNCRVISLILLFCRFQQ